MIRPIIYVPFTSSLTQTTGVGKLEVRSIHKANKQERIQVEVCFC